MRNVKVFVSSPSDVSRERTLAASVIRALNERPTIRDRYKFSPYLYEEHAPAQAGATPQEVVNREMIQPHNADILICILWSRIGTPLTEINPDTGQAYQSGTEFEFYEAYRSYLRRRSPLVLLYRKLAPPENADPEQIERVNEFFHRFEGPTAPLRGLYHTFASDEDLARALNNDIDAQIAKWERPTQRFLDQVVRPFWALLLLLVVGLIALGLLLPRLTAPAAPPIENAPFNVAIAGFTAAPGSNVAQADVQVLSEALHTNFTQRLDEVRSDLPLVVGVWSPAQVGTITGATAEERAANAEALVERLREQQNARADIVIYGVVAENGDRVSVTPEFYITDNWPEVSELFGRFELASALYARNIDQSRALSGELSNRSQVLAFITQGLVQMIFRQYDEATRAFDAALAINQQVVGRDVMYVLRGNAAISLYNQIVGNGDSREARRLATLIQQALDDFSSAIAENPDYARGYAGLGSAEYLNALESSRLNGTLTLDSATLDALQRQFEAALNASDSPPSADIPQKVAFGLGQVATLRMLTGDTAAAETARAYFEQVIEAYDDGANPRIKEIAAESTARLGLIARHQGDYEAARGFYEQAITTTDLDEREALYRRNLLEITAEEARARQDVDAAAEAYEQLLALDLLPESRAFTIFNYGKMLSEAGRDADALAAFEQVQVGDFSDAPTAAAAIWVELGNLYYDAGRLGDAINAYQQAMTLDQAGQGHLQRVIDETQAELDAEATPEATAEATPEATAES